MALAVYGRGEFFEKFQFRMYDMYNLYIFEVRGIIQIFFMA